MFVRQGKRFLLERYGNIRPTSAVGKKRFNRLRETADVGANTLIFDFNAFLQGKLPMDLRRFAVCDGVAENGITGNSVHKNPIRQDKCKDRPL